MNQRQKIAYTYVEKCYSVEETADIFGMEERCIKKIAKEIYGDTFMVKRRVNLFKNLNEEFYIEPWQFMS